MKTKTILNFILNQPISSLPVSFENVKELYYINEKDRIIVYQQFGSVVSPQICFAKNGKSVTAQSLNTYIGETIEDKDKIELFCSFFFASI
ncbi:hypothetical protein [Alistipes sp. ZOR0009]|uniref:hypothetical protein n=1 Tax=Alistipes sp. ZOR0009 TaxID=1339253 RepID=UPI0006475F3B|nr:hypothetical protein [Alistipes sp. ZOR0009]